MKKEMINEMQLREMERRLGCTFCSDGKFAEMSLELKDYSEKTSPIPGVVFGPYEGEPEQIREIVALVDTEWCQYFHADSPVFCGYVDGSVASFCIVDESVDCILSLPGLKVGSIGCVGTVPAYRHRGIGLRMVDLATLRLKSAGCHKAYVSYTHIDPWYAQLGYETVARFSFR